jgi:transposase
VCYDAGKKVKGRKIHALIDTEGLPMRVVVHSAAVQDRDGAGLVLDKIRRRFPRLELIWADGRLRRARQTETVVAKLPLLRMEIVERNDDVKCFVVLPRRRVVGRTFAWFGRNRRLAKDFENLATTLETFVTFASIQLALRRLAREWVNKAGSWRTGPVASAERPLWVQRRDIRRDPRERARCADSGSSRPRRERGSSILSGLGAGREVR